jgi:hypothetical protein
MRLGGEFPGICICKEGGEEEGYDGYLHGRGQLLMSLALNLSLAVHSFTGRCMHWAVSKTDEHAMRLIQIWGTSSTSTCQLSNQRQLYGGNFGFMSKGEVPSPLRPPKSA